MTPHSTSTDPLQKLTPAPSTGGFRPRCCRVKSFKRVGVLLAFHLLNVLVAIGGVVSVALLLSSMALMPIWFVAVLLVLLVMSMTHAVQQIKHKCLLYFGYVVLVVLYMASLSIHWYVTIGPYAIFAVGAIGVGLFFLSALAMKYLVKIDVHLASFVTPKDLDPEESMDRFKLSETTDFSYLLPHIRMTRHVCLAVVYFAVLKVAMGVLSAAVIVITVVLPATVIFSGGNAAILGDQVSRGDKPITYTVSIAAVWLVGAAGTPIVAMLSGKLTSRVCGAQQRDTEVEIEVAIPVTPEPESSTTSFAGLGSSAAVAIV
ncbi:hypothetical protein PHYPSEUDO_001054 [Phytophthora pseudosyringae]|uniref:Uncharacterized protein n=1 Tax=Phytophthora pseudosyringae TaxID=221518 RepID=A0A8T1W102_9STRA|nr:hypothetical protein PHYPSEUDO_001054 [Phytophthora pseudosyringae]